jgi:subtilisin family serine protease
MIHKRSVGVLLAAVLSAGTLVSAGGAAAAQPALASAKTVTLITGDRVLVDGMQVLPGKGRERIPFRQQRDNNGDVHVVPMDAVRDIGTGRLDPRLFNVTKLIEYGFDDTSRKDIPLIVSGGGAQGRALRSLGGQAVKVEKATAAQTFAQAQRIWLDGPVRATLDKSVPQIGAPAAWQAGYTGKGTTVAVLDTGVDATHPDLAGAVAGAQDFTGSPSGTDDRFGHGTHVASIITGAHTKYTGVAPDTQLLNGKVLDDNGSGSESGIIAGMEWAVARGAKVVNMSLGSMFPSDGKDPMAQAVNRLTEQSGTLFVVASGNSGGPPGSPGAADAALTVGAVDSADVLAPFSSRGPRWPDKAIKPDITAPGVDIAAAKAANGTIGTPVDSGHVRLSGTSMAAPHVAGAAAILAGQHPTWQASDLKAALMGSAKPAASIFDQGAGRVDIARAMTQQVHATPSSLSLGTARWPHNDDQPITSTVTYHNSGTTPVTMDLTADVRDSTGKPAPAGMFTVSPSALTVPAGGTAQATVVTDTKVDGPEVMYTGVIVAGGVRTPIAVEREVESYDVTLNFIDTEGKPTPWYGYSFVDLDREPGPGVIWYDESGTVTVRLAKGRYFFDATVGHPRLGLTTQMAEPEYVVDSAKVLNVDAREGKPLGFVVDKPIAKSTASSVSLFRETPGPYDSGVSTYFDDLSTWRVVPSKSSAPGKFRFSFNTRMTEPDASYLYHLQHTDDGRIPASLIHQVKDNSLAKVRTTHASNGTGKYGMRDNAIAKALPFTLDELYTPDVPFDGVFVQSSTPVWYEGIESITVSMVDRGYKLGGTTTNSWNHGVFGPMLGHNPKQPWGWAGREQNTIGIRLPLYVEAGTGRYEDIFALQGGTTLFADGIQVGGLTEGGAGHFEVPANAKSFRLHSEITTTNALSTKVISDSVFKSGTTSAMTALPLLAVRFTPALDGYNKAAAAVPTLVPVSVDHNAGGKASVSSVQVSHDDGVTWRAVPLVSTGGKSFAVVSHPAGATAVSLRASAQDTAGNSVDQTIIRAFLLK